MAGWGSGYVTDIPYSEGFYISQAPQHLALTAIINGIEPPDLSRGFSYCELGCGRGLTSLILAATNPDSRFHAVDFNPAHIAHAQSLSRAAEIGNITWHESDFGALGGDGELPQFDIVTMHGVWSWIAPELQNSIVHFLREYLKPGGLLYVSYNAMPAWSQTAPVQRIVKELAATMPGPSDRAVSAAIEMLKRLYDAKLIPERFEEGVRRLTETAQRGKLTYLAHEYLNEHWKPLYHSDVARAFEPAKLTYAGSASLLRNFEDFLLTPGQISLLAELPDPGIREVLKDFCVEHPLHEDVYIRGERRMTAKRRDELLKDQTLCLIRPAPREIQLRGLNDAVWRPHPEAYALFFSMLERKSRTIRELLSAPEVPATFNGNSVGVASLMVGGCFAALMRDPEPGAVAACAQFNRLIEAADDVPLDREVNIAAASLGIGLALSPGDFELYRSLRRGEEPDPATLARQFDNRCRAGGGLPVIDGKALEDPAEAIPVVERDYAGKIDRLVPIWKLTGIL